MHMSTALAVLLIAYLIGSIPFGWLIVKITTGRDVRQIESGRTGGTNVMRAAGTLAGLLTGILDVLKGVAPVWLVRWLVPADFSLFTWVEIGAPLLAILGHNYSIYLIERHQSTGKMLLRGGAGGATCLGGVIALSPPLGLIIFLLGLLVYLLIGYASVTTLSVAFFATILFAIRAAQGTLPWEYILYGLVAGMMLAWALRPNLKRLRQGNERIVGLRAWLKQRSSSNKE